MRQAIKKNLPKMIYETKTERSIITRKAFQGLYF
jgi:hypothetical protein